jgi:AraC family transcriptional regulator, regulatory protein of adaptative response / methylated-DNA-[protein]-cysteine methyltransferase
MLIMSFCEFYSLSRYCASFAPGEGILTCDGMSKAMNEDYPFDKIAESIRYIAQNYRTQPDLDDVADHIHLSKYHFHRLFQQWAGITPKQFLQFTTVEHAKKCLLEGRSTLDTALEVGLSGNGRLHDVFLKIEACTPGEFKRRGKDIDIEYDLIKTPFGEAVIAETAIGICLLSFFSPGENPLTMLARTFPEARCSRILGPYGVLVQEYFSGWKTPNRKIVLDLRGTPFQISVWKALLSIPPRRYLAYSDIARMIGRPRSARAVGTAVGSNPIAYLIPCHRVILNSGEIGEYRWGRERKIAIQGFEQAMLLP